MNNALYASASKLASYNSETGEFHWLVTKGRARKGKLAGQICKSGARYLTLCKVSTTTARWAWFYTHKEFPKTHLLHLNGDVSDCRIENLRLQGQSRKYEITHDRLLQLFSYDKETGKFTKKIKSKGLTHNPNRRSSGGYIMLCIDGIGYKAHRVAWFYVHKVWPIKGLDHINGNRADNRIANLREATQTQNMGNARKPITNTSGYKGVYFNRGAKKWQAEIKHDNQWYYLGLHSTAEAAHEAYKEAAIRLRGEFARY